MRTSGTCGPKCGELNTREKTQEESFRFYRNLSIVFVVLLIIFMAFQSKNKEKSDGIAEYLKEHPNASLVACSETGRELDVRKRTGRDRIEVTLMPLSERDCTEENLLYTAMQAAVDEHKRNHWLVTIVVIRACSDDPNVCPILADAVYIPDGKGMAGDSSSDVWYRRGAYVEQLRAFNVYDVKNHD